MEEKKLGHEPAFPSIYQDKYGSLNYIPGMNKRFYAACAAMQGILSNHEIMDIYAKDNRSNKAEILISGCYAWADELLKQE
jgi:hypothetical protein